jgi:hypothetical protein
MLELEEVEECKLIEILDAVRNRLKQQQTLSQYKD